MTEKLIAAIRKPFAGDFPEAAGHWRALAILAADALEAATVEPEWEYGHEGDTLVGVHSNASREHAIEDAEHLTRYWAPQGKTFRAVRRRKASPWVPVDGNEK